MLPAPSLTFTIPSILDDTVLDCRIYLPASFTTVGPSCLQPWRKKAAIVAHPYGPMGGSYDDPIVDLVATTILKLDFVVGTFNFRGAGGSKGRTSWTARAEIHDYMSFVGFLAHFMHALRRDLDGSSSSDDESSPTYHDLSPIPSHALPCPRPRDENPFDSSRHYTQALVNPEGRLMIDSSHKTFPNPLLLMAGYSYGSMVTTLLPSLPTILALFESPQLGSAASEIRLRATHLAGAQNESFQTLVQKYQLQSQSEANSSPAHKRGRSLQVDDPISPRKSRPSTSSIRIGGEESNPEHRRASQEIHGRRSFEPTEAVRRSIDRVRSVGRKHNGQVISPKRHVSYSSPVSGKRSVKKKMSLASLEITPGNEARVESIVLGNIEAAYLLISPLQGFVNGLATMWTTPLPRTKVKQGEPCEEESKLVSNRTLAVWGDSDVFTSSRRLKTWAENLKGKHNSQLVFEEIAGAGHFWHEEGSAYKMRDFVKEFVRSL